jgi:hypothetical protein
MSALSPNQEGAAPPWAPLVPRALFGPSYCQNRQPQVHNQRLCVQEFESIVVMAGLGNNPVQVFRT